MSELSRFVYNKGHQKSREPTREISWRLEGEFGKNTDFEQAIQIRSETFRLSLGSKKSKQYACDLCKRKKKHSKYTLLWQTTVTF